MKLVRILNYVHFNATPATTECSAARWRAILAQIKANPELTHAEGSSHS